VLVLSAAFGDLAVSSRVAAVSFLIGGCSAFSCRLLSRVPVHIVVIMPFAAADGARRYHYYQHRHRQNEGTVAGLAVSIGSVWRRSIYYLEVGLFSGGIDIAVGAIVLFLRNLAAIDVAAGTVMAIQGYAHYERVRGQLMGAYYRLRYVGTILRLKLKQFFQVRGDSNPARARSLQGDVATSLPK